MPKIRLQIEHTKGVCTPFLKFGNEYEVFDLREIPPRVAKYEGAIRDSTGCCRTVHLTKREYWILTGRLYK